MTVGMMQGLKEVLFAVFRVITVAYDTESSEVIESSSVLKYFSNIRCILLVICNFISFSAIIS